MSSPTIVAGIIGVGRPGFFRNGVTRDTRTSVSSAPITASQAGDTVTASDDIFTADDVGKILRWESGPTASVIGFVDPTHVLVTPNQSVASGIFATQGHTLGGSFGEVKVAARAGYLGVMESTFGNTDTNLVWYNLNTEEFRNLGSSENGFIVDMTEDGYMLVDKNPSFTGHTPYIYNPNSNTFEFQGLPAGGPHDTDHQAIPDRMNSSHVVAASGSLFSQPRAYRGFGGVLTDIHPADADSGGPDPGRSNCVAINEAGHIIGNYTNVNGMAGDVERGFFNDGGASFTMGGFPGDFFPYDINDSDAVVGEAEYGALFLPFLWTLSGGVVLIPLLPGTTEGAAQGVNNAGWVVGDMDGVAFLYRNGVTLNLLTIANSISPGWDYLSSADFVNNRKQICGSGSFNGVFKKYLLTLNTF